jgi:hypothetical protein
MLEKHTTITLNYTVQYRVRVLSAYPDAVLQPPGGEGWYSPGQIATLQVKDEAKDKYGIPYVFERWAGAVLSNDTIVSFAVTIPIDAEVEWGINWILMLTMVGAVLGVAAPTVLIVKKKILPRARGMHRKKIPKVANGEGKSGLTDDDMKVYNYIIDKGGSMRLAEALDDLGMSREQIKDSILRLKASQMLR